MDLLKTVFHVHTNHSYDCDRSVDQLIAIAQIRHVDCITITDHDTLSGAHEMAAKAPSKLKIIVGEEVSTTGGHVIGLFLKEFIRPGMSPRETALAIKQQGGLVVIPHPYNRIFGCGLCKHLHEVEDLIDVVEVSNAQNFRPSLGRRSHQFAHERRLPGIVGVDLHHSDHLDTCYQWMEPFETPEQFVANLRNATLVEGRHPLSYFAKSTWHVFLEYSGIGHPARFGAGQGGTQAPTTT